MILMWIVAKSSKVKWGESTEQVFFWCVRNSKSMAKSIGKIDKVDQSQKSRIYKMSELRYAHKSCYFSLNFIFFSFFFKLSYYKEVNTLKM